MGQRRTSDQSNALYQKLRDGDAKGVMKACAEATTPDERSNLIPTVHDDTILHMAIYMGKESIALEIIDICRQNDELLTKPNKFGNTALHEAVAAGYEGVVKKLLEKAPDLLSKPNKNGEMPLYTAAHFGQKKTFILLAEKLKNVPDLKPHFCSLDPNSNYPDCIRSTILHAAIHAEFFELALMIARKPEYADFVKKKDKDLKTPLQLLSSNFSAFESGMKCGRIKKFLYNCAPYATYEDAKQEDHEQISRDDSSNRSPTLFLWRVISSADETAAGLVLPKASQSETPGIPLFIATSNGILEIVEETLRVYPLSVQYTNKEKQNILHLAVMHRQPHIIELVTKKNKELTSRLARETDKNGFTILHYVGNMDYYKGGIQHGPAFQLQEELEWYEDVEKLVPRFYARNRSSIEQKETREELYVRKYKETKKLFENTRSSVIPPKSANKLGWVESKEETPREYFGRTHGELLEEAQQWLEQASNSCSLVAGLIASVAFAAAFTIPGGNNGRNGRPILIDSPFFSVFIITDALSIASSLTSLAMFLSILSSSYELEHFRRSLPRKLTLGFTFLFFSIAVTSLAFASTLMLTIPIKKRLTTTLIYCVAFLPVTMFALFQYPLHLAFKRSLRSAVKAVKRVLPWPLIKAACSKSHTA